MLYLNLYPTLSAGKRPQDSMYYAGHAAGVLYIQIVHRRLKGKGALVKGVAGADARRQY